MVAILSLEHNVEGRKERAPLGAVSYLLNITGIIGNALVFHVFRTRFSRSLNYRTFVLFLAFVDLSSTCIAHLAKEVNRMVLVYNQWNNNEEPFICQITQYVGNSVGVASFYIVMFITFERYRKICAPFKPQITVKHSRIMCACAVVLSFAMTFPIYLIHGKRNVVVGGINATRCSIKNEYDRVMVPLIYHAFILALVLLWFPAVVVFQLKIWNALVKKANSKKKMKNVNSSHKSESGNAIEKDNGETVRKDESKAAADDDEDKRNRRIAITFAIVSLLLMISFFTHTLYEFIKSTKRYLFPRQEISKAEDTLEEYLPDVVTINGILNPFVYLFTNIQFKQELRKLCGRQT